MTDTHDTPSSDPAGPAFDVGPATGPDLDPFRAVEAALTQAFEGLRELGDDLPTGPIGVTATAPEPSGPEHVLPPELDGVSVGAAARASSAVDRAVGRVARWSLDAQEWGEQRIARARQRERPVRSRRTVGGLAALGFVAFVILLLVSTGGSDDRVATDAPRPEGPPVVTAPETAEPREDVPSVPADAGVVDVPEVTTPSVRPAPPVSLRVPAIEVDASVVVVGLEPDRSMEIPADVRTVGWYDPFDGAGVVPGEPGTAVIAGHVDSRTQGRGAFWPLRELVPGDVVDVEHADGTVSRWRVESVVRHPKTDIPIEDIFTFEGEVRLALITCGGEFDRSVGAYLDNYVVTAVPMRMAVGGPAQALSGAA